MEIDGKLFVLIIVAMVLAAGIVRARLRARAPLNTWSDDDDDVAGVDLSAGRQIGLLTRENERLKGQVTRLEERLAVVERIVTDPAHRVAAEIDALR